MPSHVPPPSSLTALVSQLHPPPQSPMSSRSQRPLDPRYQKDAQPQGDLSPSPNSRQADYKVAKTPISPEPPTPLHVGPQEVWGRGSLTTCPHPRRERAPRSQGSHCSPESSIQGPQPLHSAPISSSPAA